MSKSNFTNLTADLDVIQKLDDLPNAVGGLSPAQLKAKFDEAVNTIKTYINSSLISELDSEDASASGASRVGIEPLVALPGVTNVMDAISTIIGLITTATVPDGGVSTVKLADSAVTTAKIDDGSVTTAKLAASAVTGAKTDFSAGLTIGGDLTQQGKIFIDSDCFGTTLPAAGEAGRLFFKKVQ